MLFKSKIVDITESKAIDIGYSHFIIYKRNSLIDSFFFCRHMHIKFLQEGGPSSIQFEKRMVFLVSHLDLRVIMIHLVRGMDATAFLLGLVIFTSLLIIKYVFGC